VDIAPQFCSNLAASFHYIDDAWLSRYTIPTPPSINKAGSFKKSMIDSVCSGGYGQMDVKDRTL
jgi:hypothetical protein